MTLGEVDGRADVGRTDGLHDEGGAAVERRVEDPPGLVVPIVVRQKHASADR